MRAPDGAAARWGACTERETTMPTDALTVTAYGEVRGRRLEAEAMSATTDWAGTGTWIGTIDAEGTPMSKVATPAWVPGLATWKVTVPLLGLVVWAKCQTVDGEGDPSRKARPP